MVASGATISTEFAASGFTTFSIQLPSTFTGTGLTFQVATGVGGTYATLYSSASTAVPLTVTVSGAYQLPSQLSGFPAFKIVTGTAQATAVTLLVMGKSQ